MSRALHHLSGSRRSLTLLGMLIALIVGGGLAIAYYTSHGAGTSNASVGELASPGSVNVTSAAHVSWSAVPAPTGSNSEVSYTVERDSGFGFVTAAGSCANPLDQATTSCIDVPTSGTYTYRVTAHWRSWSQAATSAAISVDVIAPASTISFPAAAGYNASRWNSSPCGGGSGAICGTAQDDLGGSGVSRVQVSIQGPGGLYWTGTGFNGLAEQTFAATGTTSWSLPFPSSNFVLSGDGTYVVRSYAADAADNIQTPGSSVTFVIDNSAPTVSSISREDSTPTKAGTVHWSVTFSESVSGVDSSDFALAGAGSSEASITAVSGSGSSYTVTATTGADGALGLNLVDDDSITDAAGNALGGTGAGNGDFTGQGYLVDKTAPAISRETVADASANTDGFIKQGGGYYTYAQVDDSGSGVAAVSADLHNLTGGASAVPMSSSGGPWTINGASYNYRSTQQAAANPLPESGNPYGFGIDATDSASNAASTTATVQVDNSGPNSGSVDATGLVGTGARYSTTTSLSIGFSAGSDAGVGLATASGFVLERASGTLSSTDGTTGDGACGSYGSYGPVATGPSSPFVDNAADGIASGHCYRYQYVVTDKLGNQTIYTSPEVKVDTTPPSTPTSATITPLTGNASQYLSGSQLYYNPAGSGSFSVDSATSDGESGISSVGFPTISGFSGGGNITTPTSGSTYQTTYSWNSNGASPSPGAQSISATNNASLTAANGSAFTLTKDATGPSGGSVDATGLTGTGSRYTHSKTLSITFSAGSDAGSGLAAGGFTLSRAEGTLNSSGGDGTCTNYGSYTTLATDPRSPYSDIVPDNNACYRYQYVVSDRVGNQTTYTSGDIKVETTAPTTLTPTFAFSNLSGSVSRTGDTIYFKQNSSGSFTVTAAASDAYSGITGYSFPTAPSGWNVSGSGASRTYSYTAAAGSPTAGSQTVSATDNAALSASAAFTLTADNTGPTIAAAVIADQNATLGGYVHQGGSYYIYANVSDGGAGVATVTGNANAITTGATAVSLTACLSGCVLNGVTYAYKSALQTANSTLSAGSKNFTVTAADNLANSTGPTTFTVTVDNTAPAPTVTTPSTGATVSDSTPALAGAASNASSDSTTVTVKIYSGTGTGGTLLQTIPVTRTSTSWSTMASALSDGTYTAQATQSDDAGNTGTSSAVTFTVNTTIAGIIWTNIDTSKNSPTCTYSFPNVTCSIGGLGGTGHFTATVTLVNSARQPVPNPTGGALTVTAALSAITSPGATLTGSPQTIAVGADTTGGTFTMTGNGGGWKATMTASVTIGGNTYTVNVAGS